MHEAYQKIQINIYFDNHLEFCKNWSKLSFIMLSAHPVKLYDIQNTADSLDQFFQNKNLNDKIEINLSDFFKFEISEGLLVPACVKPSEEIDLCLNKRSDNLIAISEDNLPIIYIRNPEDKLFSIVEISELPGNLAYFSKSEILEEISILNRDMLLNL